MLHGTTLFQALLTVHLIGLALGLGGVAVSDFSFFRTIRMGDRITPETVNWMRTFSTVIWIGLGLLALSGFGLFLFHPAAYLASPGFRAKMVFVAVLTVNGLFLNYYTTARLTTFNFSQHYQHRDAAWKARKFSFIFGAISTTSWYAALLAAMFKELIGLSFAECIGIYIAVLIGAILSALILEQYIMQRKPIVSTGPLDQTIDKLTSTTPAMVRQAVSQAAQPSTIAPTMPITTMPSAPPTNRPVES